jgi:hypothetical protein
VALFGLDSRNGSPGLFAILLARQVNIYAIVVASPLNYRLSLQGVYHARSTVNVEALG